MGRRKQIVEQCERLMDHPEYIRNIAIAAHIDHGKCIAPDSRISLGTGELLTARDLFSRVQATGDRIEDREGEAYRSESGETVVSFDRSTGETVITDLEYAVKREPTDPVVRVRTSNGHEIATTPEHQFLTLTPDGVLKFLEARSLSDGDIVVGVRNTPTEATESHVSTLFDQLADEDIGVTVTTDLHDTLSTHEVSSLDTTIETDQAPGYALDSILAACKRNSDLSITDIPKEITEILVPTEQNSPSRIRVTNGFEDIMYFAGLVHGHTAVDDAIDSLITSLPIDSDKGQINSKLHRAFHSNKSGLPDYVFTAPSNVTKAYIRGLLDTCAHIDTEHNRITIQCQTDSYRDELQLLLYQFDIASSPDPATNALHIEGHLSLSGLATIGFTDSPEQTALERLCSSVTDASIDQVPVSPEKLHAIRADIDIPESASVTNQIPQDPELLTKSTLADITATFESHDSSNDIRIDRLSSLAKADTSFVTVEEITREKHDAVYDFGVTDHHNFIAEGLVIHNTTLTDNLLAGAGMISKDLAGQQLAMDTEEDEQERGITIDAANVSMTHRYDDNDYLINLIDTPGHVDFGGDVTRAMRAVDGALVVVDAVEGTMPQTETVLRQALREDVKPALFINKVDRLINELREGPEEMQERLQSVIRDVNELIRGIAPDRYEEDNWQVSVQDGTVAFGSALYNWAISLPFMQDTGIDFGDIYDYNQNDNIDELRDQSPLADVVLNMVAEHFPNPIEAQPRRIPNIWRGDPESELAIQMRDVDDGGDVVLMVTDISLDPHAGEIATGRLFSGTIERGQDLYVSGTAGTNRIQSVGIFMGGEREEVERVPAGNIAAVTGLTDAIAGSTVSSIEMTAFESIEHISEPVITKSIEAQQMDDLPKLIEVLQQVSKEDPTIHVEINEDTGEHLISGQGELHLEVITQRIERNQGIPVRTGEPIVVYREMPRTASREVEGVSPNRHNRFYMTVEPLQDEVIQAMKRGEISMDMPEQERREVLQEYGIDKESSQNVETIVGTNIVIDDTKGIQHLNETMELVLEGFEEALNEGPLAREPVEGSLVRLLDARLHEDAIHRGPAQVIPAVRESLHRALIDAEIALREPMQNVRIDVPSEHMGAASGEIQGRRGRIDDMYQEGDRMVLEGVAPVEEMIGFSSDIRSATEGRASWNTENAGFEILADNLQDETILEIRERKGLKLELPQGVDYF